MTNKYPAKKSSSIEAHAKSGLIRTIVVLLIAVVLISLIGFDIKSAVENPQTQANFAYLRDTALVLWDNYFDDLWKATWNIIGPPLVWLWTNLYEFDWNQFGDQLSNFTSQAPSTK